MREGGCALVTVPSWRRWKRVRFSIRTAITLRSPKLLSFRVRPQARQDHAKQRAHARRRVDRELAAMAEHNVLDDGEAEPRSAFGAALARVDTIETLGQARNMLGRDAGTVVLHGKDRLATGRD